MNLQVELGSLRRTIPYVQTQTVEGQMGAFVSEGSDMGNSEESEPRSKQGCDEGGCA